MLHSRLFWKLLLVCAGLNLAAAVIFGLAVSGWQEDQMRQQVEQRLRDAALLGRGELAAPMRAGRSEQLQAHVRRLGQETGLRFTLVAMDGTVLAESEKESLDAVAAIANHRERPEVRRAILRGEGAAERTSATVNESYRYFALRAEVDGQPVGIVRTAVKAASIDQQADAVRRVIWSLAAAIFAGVLALSYWIVGHIVRPMATLTDAAEAIASGDYNRRVYVSNRDELGMLARSFNRISQDLDTRLAQLTQTNERQATVLGGMIEGVIAVDKRQRVVFANAAAGRLFGFRPPAAEGRPLLEVVRNHELDQAVSAALGTRQPQRLETSREGGERVSAAIQATPLPGNPCPGVVLVMHDTTELRRLESLRRDFIANVSHELKTPLSSIKAYAETLRNGALRDEETSRKFLERIEEQADRLHHLILDMLMLARIESDQHAFEIGSVGVADVARACLDGHRPAAEAKRIDLTTEPAVPECFVRADKEGLREILDNLVDNAIKYTPDGGRVTLRWRADGDAARIEVQDTGIGIAADHLPRVFERFYRVDRARSRELGGTGLGLSIVKHLVQSFGGSVAVDSQAGQGSTFTVQLPLA